MLSVHLVAVDKCILAISYLWINFKLTQTVLMEFPMKMSAYLMSQLKLSSHLLEKNIDMLKTKCYALIFVELCADGF